jgi:hypothetical protein
MFVNLGVCSGLVQAKVRFRKRKDSLLPAEVIALVLGVNTVSLSEKCVYLYHSLAMKN